jgi:hypothetical protein
VKHALFGSGVDSLILLIMNFLMTQGGLQEEDLTSRLVCFGVDGVHTFQGFKFRITIQIQCQYVPFTPNSIVACVHCMVHRIKLAIQALSHSPLVLTLKHFCNVCMLISTTAPKDIWSLPK